MLITQVPVFLQSLVDDCLDRSSNLRIDLRNRGWQLMKNRTKDLPGTRAFKRNFPGRHLIKHRTEREKVAAGIQFFCPYLFGRHVGDCAWVVPGLVSCSSSSAAVAVLAAAILL